MIFFFQLVSFLSKGFNVLIFLLQLGVAAAGTELKLFHFLLQLAYLFFNLFESFSGVFVNHGGAGSAFDG